MFFIVAQLELGLTPFTEDPRCKLPFTENSRTYNSMLCVLLLRILGPITLCMLSWDLQFHACYVFTEDHRTSTNLTINKLDKSDKSSNMLQVGQIKYCNQFPWGLLYLLYVLFFCLVCGCLLGKNKQKKNNNKKKQVVLPQTPISINPRVVPFPRSGHILYNNFSYTPC